MQRMHGSRFRSALLACSLLASGLSGAGLIDPRAARADVSAGEASALQGQIRGWLEGLLGPNVPLGANPVLVAPEGDHYRLSVNVAGAYGGKIAIAGDPVTALIKPVDANRWAVDELRLPSPLRVENTGDGKDMFKSWAAKVAEQTTSGVIDLSLATSSSLDTTMRGYTATTETATGSKTSHVDRSVSHNTIQPAGDGRVNMLFDGTGEHLTSNGAMPDGSPLTFSADAFKVSGHMDMVSFRQVGAAIRLGTGLMPMLQQTGAAIKDGASGKDGAAGPNAAKAGSGKPTVTAAAAGKGLPPAARASLRSLIEVMRDAIGGVEEQVSLDNLHFASDQVSGSVAHAGLGIGFGAPGGKLDAHMLFSADGIDSPMVPPGLYHDYLPRHLVIRPRISGVPTSDVAAFLTHAIDSNADNDGALEMEAMGLLAKGPLSVGIDDLSMEMGPAALKGTGSLAISSPADYSGQAQIRISGFDKLIQQSNTRPELKQAAPVLIFLKGIGKQDGDATLWNVTYQDKVLMVNGTNLSAMMPSDGGKN